jgi:hypothetical protein
MDYNLLQARNAVQAVREGHHILKFSMVWQKFLSQGLEEHGRPLDWG